MFRSVILALYITRTSGQGVLLVGIRLLVGILSDRQKYDRKSLHSKLTT